MASSLSNLVNNLSEGIHRIKYEYRHDDKKCGTGRIKCKYYATASLNMKILKMIYWSTNVSFAIKIAK